MNGKNNFNGHFQSSFLTIFQIFKYLVQFPSQGFNQANTWLKLVQVIYDFSAQVKPLMKPYKPRNLGIAPVDCPFCNLSHLQKLNKISDFSESGLFIILQGEELNVKNCNTGLGLRQMWPYSIYYRIMSIFGLWYGK